MQIEDIDDLTGKRILVVEDDYLLATDICRALRLKGATVLGPAPTPYYAMSLLTRRGIDGAVLDVNLHGMDVFEFADELVRRQTPMVFATGLDNSAIPTRHRRAAFMSKPFSDEQLLKVVSDMAHQQLPPAVPEPAAPAPVPPPIYGKDRLLRAVARAIMQRDRFAGRTAAD